MAEIEKFITTSDQAKIIEAIRLAEKNTSGEIRVHLEAHSVSQEEKTPVDAFERAKEVFDLLKMHNTRQRNGVLIYVAVKDRTLVILGDVGINDVVDKNFWGSTKDIIIGHFKSGEMGEGLVKGIQKAGEKLKHFFPFESDDQNELSDDISFGSSL